MTLRTTLLLWLGTAIAGLAVLIFAPDSGERLFSLSEDHGPSASDAVGIGLILAGWTIFLGSLSTRRRRIIAGLRERHGMPAALVTLAVFGIALVIISILWDMSYWWLLGATVLLGVQLKLAYLARDRVV